MSATADRQSMQAALVELEAAMLEASADPAQFAKLQARRDAMARELDRLEYASRREAQEQAAAHLQALRDRFADARAGYRALCADASSQLEAELAEMAARLETDLIPRCHAMADRMRALHAAEQGAVSALRKAGEATAPPIVGLGLQDCYERYL